MDDFQNSAIRNNDINCNTNLFIQKQMSTYN